MQTTNPWGTAACLTDDIEPENGYPSRLILDGSPRFIFESLCQLDGTASKLLILPRLADTSVCNSFALQANGALVETEELANKWRKRFPRQSSDRLSLKPSYQPVSTSHNTIHDTTKDTQWVLATSGTTGPPKLFTTNLVRLKERIKENPAYHEFRWGLVFDAARFAGLQVLIQAATSGAALLAADLARPIDEQVDWLITMECNAISATPSWWRQLLMVKRSSRLRLRQITLGGEIADAILLDRLKLTFPSARITQIYASTEIGVILSVHDCLPGFPAEYLYRSKHSLPLAIDQNGSLWVRQPEDAGGEVATEDAITALKSMSDESLSGTAICKSPAASAATSISTDSAYCPPSDEELSANNEWTETGDIVEIENNRVRFVGRKDSLINVGGNKVAPERVEAVLRQVNGVSDVLVRKRQSSIVGHLVEALVVLDNKNLDGKSAEQALRDQTLRLLLPYERPAFIHIVDQLPSNPALKADRKQ